MSSLPFCREELEATLRPFAEARPLPASSYTDDEAFAFDRDEIFGRAWQLAGHESELDRPGAWVLAPLTPAGVLCVRGDDGVHRAFHNICRHRGATLCEGPRGHAASIACPYHRWSWGLDGALKTAIEAPHGLDPAAAGLSPVRIERWRGFLFACLDDGAPSLAAALDGSPPWLADLPPLRRIGGSRAEVRANWKLVAENFQESHHFPLVHPSLEALTPCAAASSVLGEGPWLGGLMDLVPEAETVSLSRTRMGRPFLVPEASLRRVADACLFPALLTSLQPDYFLTYRLQPLAPDRTLVIADIWAHVDCPEAAVADVASFWDRTNAEDRAICERQQLGVSSPGYDPLGYSRAEDGVHAFDRLVAERYLDAIAPDAEDDPAEVAEPVSAPRDPAEPHLGKLIGIWGRPFIDLAGIIDTSGFAGIDDEIRSGLAQVEVSRTGGSLKHMGVVAPWVHDDPYVDYGQAIERMTRDEWLRFVSLGEDPGELDPDRRHEYSFGDETDHPLTPAQIRYLVYRHRVYFPWSVVYHLLENDRWEDKHRGAGKAFSAEAERVFPKTLAFLRSLPFTEMGRVVIFGIEANQHAPMHRDSEPGRELGVPQSISFQPRVDKRLCLVDDDGASRTVIRSPIYWFNDMDYHGVLPDPYFRYSVRADGVFDRAWIRALERRMRR